MGKTLFAMLALVLMLAALGCEDDVTDLDYLNDASVADAGE